MNPGGSQTLELRILSGMHAGARAALDADEYSIGAMPDCDLVLTDDGVLPAHARIVRGKDDGWELDWNVEDDGDDAPAPLRLEQGKAVALGPVIVAVDEPDAEWPTLEQLVLGPQALAAKAPVEVPRTPELSSMQRGIAIARRVLGRMTVWLMTTAAAVISAAALVAWPMGIADKERSGASAAPRVAAPASHPAPGSLELAQKEVIERALAKLNLGERVKLEYADGGWLVRTNVLTDTEAESITAALSRIQPHPGLRMTTEQDLRDAVSDTLLRLAPEYRGKITLRYVGDGRFRLEGYMVNPADRDRLAQALSSALPEVHGWDIAVTAGDEMAQKLLADLSARGNWEVAGQVKNGLLQIHVNLRRSQVRQWEQALLSAARANPFPFNAELQLVQSADEIAPRSEALPFEIRAAVGGDMPYVLLPGGQRLARGGEWHGWRLASVSDTQLVFENGSRRAVVPR